MMIINILVEGQTEELFIKDILAPYLLDKGIFMTPTIINTKIVKDGANFKGGLSNRNYGKFINDIKRLINSTPHGFVTTFIDYYALPTKFPNFEDRLTFNTSIAQVEFIEKKLSEYINSENFIPYIQIHEFEAFLFTEKSGFENNIEPSDGNISNLIQIINDYNNPEDINQGQATAPSKRIEANYKSYQKMLEANMMILDIGLEIIIDKCPHFKSWIDLLITKVK